MASIKVKFRPSSIPDREGIIYYQIIHKRLIRQLLTDYKIFPDEWNENGNCVVNRNKSDRSAFLTSIRERIRWDVERLKKIIRRFENEELSYSSETIIEEFHRYSTENTLFNLMQNAIARLKHQGKTRTSETYMATLNSFKKFRNGCDIRLDLLNSNIIESYQSWLKLQGLIPNTTSFYIRILRAIYNRAIEDEIIVDRNPFRRVYTGVDKTIKRALPISIIKKIKNLELSLKPNLQYARDMFILSFMLRGMSFIDMAFLRKTDLNNGYVVYRRRKTGQLLTIKWTREMQEILDCYSSNKTQYLLPIIQRPNTKEIYTYRKIGTNINKNLKTIGRKMGLPIPLTMYVARHSWASAAKTMGIPLSVISEGMGHDNETTTQIYLASLDTSDVDNANSLILKNLV